MLLAYLDVLFVRSKALSGFIPFTVFSMTIITVKAPHLNYGIVKYGSGKYMCSPSYKTMQSVSY